MNNSGSKVFALLPTFLRPSDIDILIRILRLSEKFKDYQFHDSFGDWNSTVILAY